MDSQKKRIAVQGLRRADADTLLVLTQDVLRANLGRIDPATLADLLALSESENGLGVALARDLRAFRDQMFREMSDLPDSPVLAEFARDLAEISPKRVPLSLREAVIRLAPDRKHPEATETLAALLERWEGTVPDPYAVPVRAPAGASKKKEAAAPSPLTPHKEKLATVAPTEKKARTPTAQVDERRAEWVQDEVLSRLEPYGINGLKEAILVAGARFRSPWKDMGEDEVLVVLRRLRRENRLRFSAGRWSLNNARG